MLFIDDLKPHTHLSLPFGIPGARLCIGRWISEISMRILLLRLSQSFYIKSNIEIVDCISLLINQPDRPIGLKFIRKK